MKTDGSMCLYCTRMLYEKVALVSDVTTTASIVEADGREHTVARCRDVASNRMRQLEHGRGAGYCGYQHGLGATNHGGGCEGKFVDAESVYRCLDCGGTFHKECLRKHFAEHSGDTKERLRAALERLQAALEPFARFADAVDKANGGPIIPEYFARASPRFKTAGVEIGYEHFHAAREALSVGSAATRS